MNSKKPEKWETNYDIVGTTQSILNEKVNSRNQAIEEYDNWLTQKASVEALAKIVDPLVLWWSHNGLSNTLTLKCTEAELLEKLHNYLTKEV